jgi:hypothetical protein
MEQVHSCFETSSLNCMLHYNAKFTALIKHCIRLPLHTQLTLKQTTWRYSLKKHRFPVHALKSPVGWLFPRSIILARWVNAGIVRILWNVHHLLLTATYSLLQRTVLPNQCSSEPGDSQGKYIVYSNIFLHLSTTQTNMVCIQIVLNVTFVTLYGKVGSFYKETYGMKKKMTSCNVGPKYVMLWHRWK